MCQLPLPDLRYRLSKFSNSGLIASRGEVKTRSAPSDAAASQAPSALRVQQQLTCIFKSILLSMTVILVTHSTPLIDASDKPLIVPAPFNSSDMVSS